jgi:excisionase family DNA binding protein
MTIPYAERLSSTVEEACDATGLGKTKLYELIATGEIETATVGTRRLVLVRSVLRLIDPTHNPTHNSPPVAGELERTGAVAIERQRTASLANNYGPRRLKSNG